MESWYALFEFYLKTEKECQQNTVIRYMKCLKKITNLALANEWITKDPFIGIKFHEKEVIREFLTMDELLTIYHKEFPLERITIVRDVFIFAAFTGLAFIDVQQLAPEHIVEDSNGNLWIRKPRQKTKNMCNIPLLDIPLEILRKYAEHPACQKKKQTAASPLQSEDEQLSERNRRLMSDKQDLDHTCSPALVCDLCMSRQRCEHRECGKNARPFQYKNDAALCTCVGFLHSARYE